MLGWTMVHAVTMLSVLRMLTTAQFTCDNGAGKVTYERFTMPSKNQGYNLVKSDLSPESVLRKCIDHCYRDGQTCRGFTFQPGKWTGSGWSESSCILSKDSVEIQLGGSTENNVKNEYFNQICLDGRKMEEMCQNKTYAFTSYPNIEVAYTDAVTVQARSRVQCMNRCLSEESFQCRSAVFTSSGECKLLRQRGLVMKTVRGSFYLENDCMHGISRCEGFTQYVKEDNVNLVETRHMARVSDAKLDDCVKLCRDDKGSLSFNCKSFEYSPTNKECLLSEDNSLSSNKKFATSPSDVLYELYCVEGAKLDLPENKGVGYLYGRENRYYEEEVPFQRYRNSILQADFDKTFRDVELGRCLDECLHYSGSRCRSVVYSTRNRECRLSMYNQRDSRILYDPFFDYYENIIGSGPSISASNGYYDKYPGAFRPSRPGSDQSGSSSRGSSSSSSNSLGSTVRRTGRCDPGTGDSFRQVRSRTRLRKQMIRRFETVNSLFECEQECLRERSFKCLSFNYIVGFTPTAEENCELSDRNAYDFDIDNPAYFEQSERFDFYQREARQQQEQESRENCLDVSQTCDQDGMDFTLRIPEGFTGRIYTHNNYARSGCYVRGTGGQTYTLRIPAAGNYPDCGTTQYGDTITNIVVVQFSERIQTSLDMKYNLTCTVRGPGSAVVTSGYIGAGAGQPVPIEYLPAEHTLDSRVRLVIKYQDRPTTTIAVGDPLQFSLETQEGENLLRDIFATNVIAKDPYSDRVVELIDSRGCPVDPYVFPALGLSRNAEGLETSFNAFKIPESNFLVFEATVRSCRSGCRPAVCDGPSGRDNSFGRRRRDTSEEKVNQDEDEVKNKVEIKEMFRVYETRASIPEEEVEIIQAKPAEVCVTSSSYSGMIGGIVVLAAFLCTVIVAALFLYRKNRFLEGKYSTDSTMSDIHLVSKDKRLQQRYPNGGKVVPQERYLPPFGEAASAPTTEELRWQDPSEPIYTDPSLFEKL